MALSYVYANSGCLCGSQLAVCLVSLFVSVCRSCVSSSSCPASTHTALVSSPSLAVLHLTTYLPIDKLSYLQTYLVLDLRPERRVQMPGMAVSLVSGRRGSRMRRWFLCLGLAYDPGLIS